MTKPLPPDDEIEHEDTQIFDSKKHPVLKREPARKTGAPPTRPTPRQPQEDTPPPLEPQATRVVVMHVPPEAIPTTRDRPSQAFVVPRGRPSQPIATPRSTDEAARSVEVTPPRRKPPSAAPPVVEPALARTVIAEPLFANRAISDTPIPAAKTVIAEIDAGATAPVLKLPPDLRATLDSNPGLQATFDTTPELRAIDGRADSFGGEHVETNPMAVPLHAMASHRSTAPMPIPEHTKIGVVERPLVAPPAPRAKPATTPPSQTAAMAMLDAARARQIPDRVAHITPTAMNSVVVPEGPHAGLHDPGDSHDDDNYNETRERPIDRDALRKLRGAAELIALSATVPAPAIVDPPSSPVVLTGPPLGSSEPRIEVARPTAPRGGLVWLWMVLAALAIAAAVATAMWYLAS